MPIKDPHPLYSTWAHFKSRAKWGGLPLAEEWFEFESFLRDVGVRPKGHILCVIDVDIGYAPGNVVWRTQKERLPTRKDFRPKFNHPLYMIWRSMLSRCLCKTHPSWKDYGGRGISVCERWQKNFHDFVADIGERPKGYTLERVDNDKGYSPDNCKWATRAEQAANKRNTTILTFNGETMTLTAWARKIGLKADTLKMRLLRGIPLERALTMPRASPGKARATQQKAKTHCKNGHPFNEENTYFCKTKAGNIGRYCRECHRLREKVRRKPCSA